MSSCVYILPGYRAGLCLPVFHGIPINVVVMFLLMYYQVETSVSTFQ